MSDIDTRIDEILKRLCMDYMTNYGSLENDLKLQIQATDHNKYVAKQSIKQLMADEFEKMIGKDEEIPMENRMSDIEQVRLFNQLAKAVYSRNALRRQLRQKLREWKK